MIGGLDRGDLGQPDEAVLGADIGGLVAAGDEAVRRGDIDDPPPAPRDHQRQRRFRGVKRRREVDRDDRVPALFREVDDRRDMLDPGIVDEDVDGAELAHRLGDETTDLHRLGHVGRRGRSRAPHAARRGRRASLRSPRDRQSRSSRCRAPAAASALAMPSPIPLVEPVTTAVLPFNISFLHDDWARASGRRGCRESRNR